MSSWNNIVAIIKNVLEETAADDLITKLQYGKTLVMTDNLASSVYNGSYFVRLMGIPEFEDSVNKRFVAHYQVRIELCTEISAGNSVQTYNDSIQDIEVLLKYLLQQSVWENYSDIQMIKFVSVGEAKYSLKGNIFQIIPLDLEFDVIITY
jgi:hypothetical protein